MYQINFGNRYKKDIKRCKKRRLNFELLKKAVLILEEKGKLPQKYKPHKLKGDYKGHWECHLKPDWLLIWKQNDDEKIIVLYRTGTHADLF